MYTKLRGKIYVFFLLKYIFLLQNFVNKYNFPSYVLIKPINRKIEL